jgi:hypothetical protein
MTESEWLTSTDGTALFSYQFVLNSCHGSPPLARKLRLYLTAVCRLVWGRLPAAARAAIDFVERFADDPRPDPAVWAAVRYALSRLQFAYSEPEAVARCEQDLRAVGLEVQTGPPWRGTAAEWQQVTLLALSPIRPDTLPVLGFDHPPELVRCVFGNPFRPAAFDPQWRTRTTMDLARTMYGSRDFGATPILADALEESGCDDPRLLAHCRGSGPHVRGCWAVDAVLGRA